MFNFIPIHSTMQASFSNIFSSCTSVKSTLLVNIFVFSNNTNRYNSSASIHGEAGVRRPPNDFWGRFAIFDKKISQIYPFTLSHITHVQSIGNKSKN